MVLFTCFPSEPCTTTPTLKLIVLLLNKVCSEFLYLNVTTQLVPLLLVGVFGVTVPLLLFVAFVTFVILN